MRPSSSQSDGLFDAIFGRGAAARNDRKVSQHRGQSPLRHQHRGGVEDVLARGAAMDLTRGVVVPRLPYLASERGDQRDHRVSGVAGSPRELIGVVELDPATTGNGLGNRPRRQPHPRQGFDQRRLDVEHRLEPGGVADLRGNRPSAEDAAEEALR